MKEFLDKCEYTNGAYDEAVGASCGVFGGGGPFLLLSHPAHPAFPPNPSPTKAGFESLNTELDKRIAKRKTSVRANAPLLPSLLPALVSQHAADHCHFVPRAVREPRVLPGAAAVGV